MSAVSAPSVPLFLVLAGPAGSGKSTLCDRLVAENPTFSRVVTTTTRPPRPGEVNGVHYHFFNPDEFERRIAAGPAHHIGSVFNHLGSMECAFIAGKALDDDL